MEDTPAIGDQTEFGEVVATGIRGGERYFIAMDDGMFSLIPLLTLPQRP